MSNRDVLKYCPNYYEIIGFNPIMEDRLTEKLIQMYQEYIFKIDINNEEDVENIKELDHALIKYIDDYTFRREVQSKIVAVKVKNDCKDIVRFFMEFVIKIFNAYEDCATRVIYISRWI